MSHKLVIFPAIEADRLQSVVATARSTRVVNAASREEALREVVEADAFFGKITPELLAVAKRLRWVQSATASLEHYIFPELVAHPCTLTNMRGLFSDVIADHVFGFILCFARNLHTYIRQQTQRVWMPVGGEEARTNFVSGPGVVSTMDRAHKHLADCTLGVVGVGQIGSEILRRGRSFGMRTLGVDVHPKPVSGVELEVWPLSRLDELLGASDFVVIAAPHTPETYKMFRRPQFARMRRDAHFINIGRGAIVDLADLTQSLQEGLIAGAALDVYEIEPLPADHVLWGLPNVILTPHVAGASPRVPERHLATLLENLRRFEEGREFLTPVDKAHWF